MPDSPSTADTLAWAYYYKSMYREAESTLEPAVKLQPGNPSFHYHLGMIYDKLGKKDVAREELNRALRLEGSGKNRPAIEAALANL